MITQMSQRAETAAYLAGTGRGRSLVTLKTEDTLFSQGERADCVFYLQTGGVKLTAVSNRGDRAIIRLISTGDFVGEESVAGNTNRLRTTTATAVTPCNALKIEGPEIIRMMHENPAFGDAFRNFLVNRIIRTQADLANQRATSPEEWPHCAVLTGETDIPDLTRLDHVARGMTR